MTSCSFENNRIVKGKIQNKIPPSAASLINDAAVTAYMLKNAGNSDRVMTAQAGKNLGNWLFLKYMLACAAQIVRLVLLF